MFGDTLREKMLKSLEITARAAGFGEPRSLGEIVGALIGVFLSFLGVIFFILILYGGFTWMTSGGNEQKILKAKRILTQAVIGIIIVISAYSITSFVFHAMMQAND